ncbi:unnamed protein product [Diamesa tonsa]
MEMADEEFREYIASFDPTNDKKKYDDPNLLWSFRNYDKLNANEKKQHWLEFKKPFKHDDQARELYKMLLQRKTRPTSLQQLRQDLKHYQVILPLEGQHDEDEIVEHQWKAMNAGKEIKYFEAEMRMDEDINEMVFHKYRSQRHKFFDDLQKKNMLILPSTGQSEFYRLMMEDADENTNFATLDELNNYLKQDQKQIQRKRQKRRYVLPFEESFEEDVDDSWLDFVEDSKRTSKILPETKKTRKLLRDAKRKRRLRKAKRQEEFGHLEPLMEESPPPQQEEQPEAIVIDGAKLLQGVINGHYTMEDITLAKNGFIPATDPIEKSALQLFDNVVNYSRKHTRNILQSTNDPLQFFQSIQQSGIDIENMRPVQLDQCVESAATAIDLMSYTRTEPNEVMDACECLMKAQLMYEAEVNLKKVAEITAAAEAKWMRDQENIATLHRAAYGQEQRRPDEDYDIFMKYDLSLLPSDDPSVYKPLEIISYIGLTRPNQ